MRVHMSNNYFVNDKSNWIKISNEKTMINILCTKALLLSLLNKNYNENCKRTPSELIMVDNN